MYDVHFRLIGNCMVDFLLVLMELFSLGVTAEALQANINENRHFRSNGASLTQNLTEKGSPPPTILLVVKLN